MEHCTMSIFRCLELENEDDLILRSLEREMLASLEVIEACDMDDLLTSVTEDAVLEEVLSLLEEI
jgi:hypothetical protein